MRGIICAKTGLGKAHYIDSFAGMMSSLRKIAGKTNIPSSPRDQSIHWPKTTDRFWKNLWYGSILKGYAKNIRQTFASAVYFLSDVMMRNPAERAPCRARICKSKEISRSSLSTPQKSRSRRLLLFYIYFAQAVLNGKISNCLPRHSLTTLYGFRLRHIQKSNILQDFRRHHSSTTLSDFAQRRWRSKWGL